MSFVLCELRDGVAVVTLNRPERHNALVLPLLDELRRSLLAADSDTDATAVVLRAAGRSFSTGGDVGAFAAAADLAEYGRALVGELHATMMTMLRMRLPIVTAVHGTVTGGALGLLLSSDLVLMAPRATITPWYSVVGFSPDGGWTALLPAIIGPQRTKDILLRNRTITADEAVAWGIANAVEPADRVVAAAVAAARRCGSGVAGVAASTKRLMAGDVDRLGARLGAELEAFVAQLGTDAAQEGMRSFLEGRSIDPSR